MFFGLLGKKLTKNYLGIDIGTGGLKAVELMNEKGRGRLLTYGYSERQASDSLLHPLDNPKETAELILKICKKSGIVSHQAIAALPLSSVFSTIVAVPRNKDERVVKEAINEQIQKLSPMPLAEMITYSTFIDPLKIEEKKEKSSVGSQPVVETKKRDYVRVLVTGAAKSLVQKYIEIFKLAKLELLALDTEAFALIRSLVGKDKSTVMIIDMGSVRSNLTIVEKGVPFLVRSINIGGSVVTQKITQQLGISDAEAERLKQDLATMAETDTKIAEGLQNILGAILQPLINEIRYSFEVFAKMELTEGRRVEKIILTGGSAHLPGLVKEMTKALNINVYIGDPWARIVTPEELRPMLDEIGPRLSVAVGLAMREIE
ncbi:MAG: pilus assembly protein PilM [Candidatus Uhrbacteria bacterium]